MLDLDGWELRAAAVLLTGVAAAAVLYEVFWTVFFASTLAYVLVPVRKRLDSRGVPPKLSAAALTVGIFLGLAALTAPILFLLYTRRQVFLDFLTDLPEEFGFSFLDFTYSVDTTTVTGSLENYLSDAALNLASSSPSLSLKVVLGSFLVYAALSKPNAVRSTVVGAIPAELEPVLDAYSDRLASTLYGLYVVQAATAALTFVVSLPVFFLLGYDAFFSLAVISGALQFIPVVGPSAVIALLSVFELATSGTAPAIVVMTVGVFVVGLLPDAIIRPRLASRTTGLSGAMYFLGFIGGVLTVGAVGVIAGPVAVALFLESVGALSRAEQD